VKRLFALSGNRCAFPKCESPLVQSGSIVGVVCHIKADSPGGPRYDTEQTDNERHAFENLLLMCGVHHKVIDDDEGSYTVARLLAIKEAHETAASGAPEPGSDATELFVAAIAGTTVFGNLTINQGGQQAGTATADGPKLSIGFGSTYGTALQNETTLAPLVLSGGEFYVGHTDTVSIRTDNTGTRSARDVQWSTGFQSESLFRAAPAPTASQPTIRSINRR